MTDEIRELLLNPPSRDGYVHVVDEPTDVALALFGLGGTYLDARLVDRLLPLALAPDLAWARDVFDARLSPDASRRTSYEIYVDPNGGEGGSTDLTSFEAGHGDVEVSLTVPTRQGYVFAGWLFSHPSLASHCTLSAAGATYSEAGETLTVPGGAYSAPEKTLSVPGSTAVSSTFVIPAGFADDVVVQATWI